MGSILEKIERYGGPTIGLITGFYFYQNNITFWGENHIIVTKSMDIGFILFGFFLTVLALIVQGNNITLQRLRKYKGYSRIIKFSRRVVVLSIIIGFYSLAISSLINENLNLITNQILFSIFTFFWIWLLWDSIIFLIVFYNIILSTPNE